jgi:hypothetical protein
VGATPGMRHHAGASMRPYLYVWNRPAGHCLTASGLELADLLPDLASGGGVFLLRHRFDDVERDPASGLDYVAAADLPQLAAEDVYSWGDVSWADYAADTPPLLSPTSIAELLYFAHAGGPLRDVAIPGLGNRFLASGHDDGWCLRLHYVDWADVEATLARVLPASCRDRVLASLATGAAASWIEDGTASPEETSTDIDAILNRRLPR